MLLGDDCDLQVPKAHLVHLRAPPLLTALFSLLFLLVPGQHPAGRSLPACGSSISGLGSSFTLPFHVRVFPRVLTLLPLSLPRPPPYPGLQLLSGLSVHSTREFQVLNSPESEAMRLVPPSPPHVGVSKIPHFAESESELITPSPILSLLLA